MVPTYKKEGLVSSTYEELEKPEMECMEVLIIQSRLDIAYGMNRIMPEKNLSWELVNSGVHCSFTVSSNMDSVRNCSTDMITQE